MTQTIAVDMESFVATEYPQVVAAVGLITGNRQDAPDAVQDAIVGYLAKPPNREIQNLAAWITVVASNRLRDAYRSRDAEQRALAKVGLVDEAGDDALSSFDIDVKRALTALPPKQREAAVLHYLLDHSVNTIAEALGVSSGTVETQLFRARQTLAMKLRKEDHRG
ncbi:RNA polymerase sigma factor [Microcella sp.]|uniref:RNA polymerase sigma factor n=1 Tax=Microcella sp. TaxID=1913979 RepID=UPI00255EBE9A|nr:RNA polymerase sigma factor [Microcella sp.]MBX9471697.1 RNA polymerase sigma factor [Microcella sp.]